MSCEGTSDHGEDKYVHAGEIRVRETDFQTGVDEATDDDGDGCEREVLSNEI